MSISAAVMSIITYMEEGPMAVVEDHMEVADTVVALLMAVANHTVAVVMAVAADMVAAATDTINKY